MRAYPDPWSHAGSHTHSYTHGGHSHSSGGGSSSGSNADITAIEADIETLLNQAIIEDYFFVNQSDITVMATVGLNNNDLANWCIDADTVIEIVV